MGKVLLPTKRKVIEIIGNVNQKRNSESRTAYAENFAPVKCLQNSIHQKLRIFSDLVMNQYCALNSVLHLYLEDEEFILNGLFVHYIFRELFEQGVILKVASKKTKQNVDFLSVPDHSKSY